MNRGYRKYLQSPEWKEKRARVLAAANYRCELCKRKKATQVHHLTYKRIFKEPPEDLIAICRFCHDEKHPDYPEVQKRIKRRMKMPKKVKCPWCKKKVSTERHLKQHMDTTHGPGKKPTLEQLEHERREAERDRMIRKKEERLSTIGG